MLIPQSVLRVLYTGLAVARLWLFSRRESSQTADTAGRLAPCLIRSAVVILPGLLVVYLSLLPLVSTLVLTTAAPTTAAVFVALKSPWFAAASVDASAPRPALGTAVSFERTQTGVTLGSSGAFGYTTAPATGPVTPRFAPPRAFATGVMLTGCVMLPAMCGLLVFGVGAIVLLVGACIALYDAAARRSTMPPRCAA